jgi:hypothetical protein
VSSPSGESSPRSLRARILHRSQSGLLIERQRRAGRIQECGASQTPCAREMIAKDAKDSRREGGKAMTTRIQRAGLLAAFALVLAATALTKVGS